MSAEPKNGAIRLNLWLGIGASVFVFLLAVFTGGFWLSNLTERLSAVEKNTAQSELRESVSGQQHKIDSMDIQLRQIQSDVSVLSVNSCQQFAKVETQMGQVETIINKDNVDFQRYKSQIDHKLYDILPAGIYYPISIPHEILPCK